MGKVYKFFSNILIIILSVIVIILLISFFQMNVLNKSYCNLFGFTFFDVATGSMEPTIMKEDIIIIKLNDKYEKNDIITYKSGNEFITHRVISIDGDNLITKGDSNNAEDEPINKEDVIGRVVFVLNNVSVWKKVFTDIRVIIPLVITFILLIALILYQERNNA